MKQRKKIAFAGKEKQSRKKWWESDFTLDNVEAWLRVEFGPWPRLTDEQMFDPAFEVIVRADYNRDFLPLVEFVRTNTLSAWGRALLADLLYRRLVHKRLPIYEVPKADLMLALAKDRVRDEIKNGASQPDAILKIAKAEGIPKKTLENSFRNKRASERRALKGFRGAVPKRRETSSESGAARPATPRKRGG